MWRADRGMLPAVCVVFAFCRLMGLPAELVELLTEMTGCWVLVWGFELCRDWFLVKLNMLVRSLPNWRARERLREATVPWKPSLLLTLGIPDEAAVVFSAAIMFP